MNKKFKFLNGIIGLALGSSLLVGLMFLSACDKDSDPEPEGYQLAGTYTFKKATLQTPITIPGLPTPIPAPSDITNELASGLLAEAPCANPANGAVELKSNFELFFTCVGETNSAKAGTWTVNSDTTELNLNLSVSSGNLQLKISELIINETTNVISGKISNFPVTKNLIAGFLNSLPVALKESILAGIADDYVALINVDIEFQKMP